MLVTASSNGCVSMTDAHVGSLLCSHVGDDSFTSCPMRCVTTLVQPKVSPATGEAESSVE